MSGVGPVLACAGYALLLWAVALGLDAIGRRSLRARHPHAQPVAITSDVARFHSVIAGAVLGAGAFVLVSYMVARSDRVALLLAPVAAGCLLGSIRRIAPLWREP